MLFGLWFGIFQAIMPVIGYFLGSTFEAIVKAFDHWIAFILLGAIGANMIKESLKKNNKEISDDIGFKSMLLLAIATSIDALAVGIAYVCTYGNNNVVLTFTSIGIVAFLISILGVKIGNKVGNKYEKKAKFMGGLILIILGVKILVEHLGILGEI